MPQVREQLILFLGDAARVCEAERLFQSLAKAMGLPWRAIARVANLSATPEGASAHAISESELESARAIVVVNGGSVENGRERFPKHVSKLEVLQVDPATAASMEAEINSLIARLLGGRSEAPPEKQIAAKKEPVKKMPTVRVGRETKGRRGKGVTIVSDVPLNEAGLHELATKLKERCGTGGTVKDGQIEIQGDQRDRLTVELEKLGYKVKRVGG